MHIFLLPTLTVDHTEVTVLARKKATFIVATDQTVPTQINKPTKRTTMRWMFQCFEGIDLLHIRSASRWQTQVLGLQALHLYSQFALLKAGLTSAPRLR